MRNMVNAPDNTNLFSLKDNEFIVREFSFKNKYIAKGRGKTIKRQGSALVT